MLQTSNFNSNEIVKFSNVLLEFLDMLFVGHISLLILKRIYRVFDA
jgi:hypothetical protein